MVWIHILANEQTTGISVRWEKQSRLVEYTLGTESWDQGAEQSVNTTFVGEVSSSCCQASVSLSVKQGIRIG